MTMSLAMQETSKGPTKGLDRRRDARIRIDLPIRSATEGKLRNWRLVDISCSGALVERHGGGPPPQMHTMRLNAGPADVRLLARVVRADRGQHAVAFLCLDDVQRLEVAELIDCLVDAGGAPGAETTIGS